MIALLKVWGRVSGRYVGNLCSFLSMANRALGRRPGNSEMVHTAKQIANMAWPTIQRALDLLSSKLNCIGNKSDVVPLHIGRHGV